MTTMIQYVNMLYFLLQICLTAGILSTTIKMRSNQFVSQPTRCRISSKHVSLGDFYIHWLRCMMEVKQQPSNELAKSVAVSLQNRLHQLKQNLAFKAVLLTDPRFNYISSSVLTPEEKEETRVSVQSWSYNKPETSVINKLA